MLNTTEETKPAAEPKPSVWGFADDLDQEANNLECIQYLLHITISERRIGERLNAEEANVAAWLVNQLHDLKVRLEKQATGLVDLHKASKEVKS